MYYFAQILFLKLRYSRDIITLFTIIFTFYYILCANIASLENLAKQAVDPFSDMPCARTSARRPDRVAAADRPTGQHIAAKKAAAERDSFCRSFFPLLYPL